MHSGWCRAARLLTCAARGANGAAGHNDLGHDAWLGHFLIQDPRMQTMNGPGCTRGPTLGCCRIGVHSTSMLATGTHLVPALHGISRTPSIRTAHCAHQLLHIKLRPSHPPRVWTAQNLHAPPEATRPNPFNVLVSVGPSAYMLHDALGHAGGALSGSLCTATAEGYTSTHTLNVTPA
jgi:hypothetical protein